MKNVNTIILAAILLFTLGSCQKVIDVKLDNAEPKLVAYGNITDQPGPYKFYLSETIDYDQPNNFPKISGATITIDDGAGNKETLVETTPGEYSTTSIQGSPGRTYSLDINHEGDNYTSVVKMATPISIDSIKLEAFNTPGGEVPILTTYYQDTKGENNYYYINYLVNGKQLTEYTFLSDDLRDGEEMVAGYVPDPEEYEDILPGDTITVQLQCIDAGMYEYYLTLDALVNAGGGFGASTPENPVSNITGQVLGYFKVYSQTEMDFIIQ